MNRPSPASTPRLTEVTASASTAAASTATIPVLPPKRLLASGLAAAASGTSTAAHRMPAAALARRATGMIPSPLARRAATSRITSCSTGRNRPRPAQKTIVHSTDMAAAPAVPRLCQATASWA